MLEDNARVEVLDEYHDMKREYNRKLASAKSVVFMIEPLNRVNKRLVSFVK